MSSVISYTTSSKEKTPRIRMNRLTPWLFVIPPMLCAAVFRYFPVLKAFYISLFEYDAVTPPGKFIGLKNYYDILVQHSFWQAWQNTFVFLALTLGLVFLIPLIQAIFLNEIIKGRKLFSTMYLITAVIPISVNVIIWKWVWNPDYGLANAVINFFGLESKAWLSDPFLTKFCIVFPGIFGGTTAIGAGTATAVLMYLAAIMGISEEIYESAYLDGCSGWKRIFYIILPNIKFLVLVQLVLTTIAALQILDLPYQFTSGGPSGASTSVGIFIYNTVNQELSYGRGNATALLVFIVIAVLIFLQLKLDKSESE